METKNRTIEVQETYWPYEPEMPWQEFLEIIRSTPGVAYARKYANRHVEVETDQGGVWNLCPGDTFCYSPDIGLSWAE